MFSVLWVMCMTCVECDVCCVWHAWHVACDVYDMLCVTCLLLSSVREESRRRVRQRRAVRTWPGLGDCLTRHSNALTATPRLLCWRPTQGVTGCRLSTWHYLTSTCIHTVRPALMDNCLQLKPIYTGHHFWKCWIFRLLCSFPVITIIKLAGSVCVCACVRACVRACMRACMCMCGCKHVCVGECACMCVYGKCFPPRCVLYMKLSDLWRKKHTFCLQNLTFLPILRVH